MGCRLPKLRKAEERRSPGNIYSTLRRPQVETKVGVAYTYHFLDFMLGKEEVPVSSVLCLSSVRELPVQVRDLYAQGFVLVAVHPFVHPCGPRHAHIQRQLHRAVLVRETPSSEKSQLRWSRHRLETDVCVAGNQAADPDVIQSYVKRIQDVAEQGVMFVGFLQQPGGGPCFLGNWDLEELSSLHSSPSPIHRNPFSAHTSPTDPTEPHPDDAELDQHFTDPQELEHKEHKTQTVVPVEPEFSQYTQEESGASQDSTTQPDGDAVQRHPSQNPLEEQGNQLCPSPGKLAGTIGQNEGSHRLEDAYDPPDQSETTDTLCDPPQQRERLGSSSDSWLSSPELDHKCEKRSSPTCADGQRGLTTHNNNNHIRLKNSGTEKNATSPPGPARMQLFALYNHTEELNTSLRFYSLRVPLQVQKEAGLITEVDAHWLDHMTQHFTSGANLIDGFFHLEEDNGSSSTLFLSNDTGKVVLSAGPLNANEPLQAPPPPDHRLCCSVPFNQQLNILDNGVSSVDSVFIFQSSAEETTNTSYDAIVVEQWTVVDGVVVKTDYIPLLQSLAPYGWRLMCVLPTPIVKTNSDGSLSTKQILFLQRPILQRKRKDFKMLNLRGRNKAKKNSAGKTTEETGSRSPVMETEMDSLRGNTKEEEEGRKSRDSGRSEGAALQRGGGEERESGARHQKAFLFLSGSRASVDDQEEETDIDDVPLSRLEKSVRWTDVCQRDDGGVKEEAKTEERIKQQLFSGVC